MQFLKIKAVIYNMTVTMKVSLLLFIMCQGGILSIVCFSFLQIKQISMEFWYPWNLTHHDDKYSIADKIQYRNQIYHKSKLKCVLIPNSEGPCSSEASDSYISMTSFFACREDTIKYNSLLLGLQHLLSSSLCICFPRTQASL